MFIQNLQVLTPQIKADRAWNWPFIYI